MNITIVPNKTVTVVIEKQGLSIVTETPKQEITINKSNLSVSIQKNYTTHVTSTQQKTVVVQNAMTPIKVAVLKNYTRVITLQPITQVGSTTTLLTNVVSFIDTNFRYAYFSGDDGEQWQVNRFDSTTQAEDRRKQADYQSFTKPSTLAECESLFQS